jgi:hypothetical protein
VVEAASANTSGFAGSRVVGVRRVHRVSTDDSEEMTPAEREPDETVSEEGSEYVEPTEDDPGDSEETTTAEEETTSADGISVSDAAVYSLIGVITGVVAWLLIPLFGVITAYAGYQLYEREARNVVGGAFVVAGLLPFFLWIGVLVQALLL